MIFRPTLPVQNSGLVVITAAFCALVGSAEAQLMGFYREVDLTAAEEVGLAGLAEGRKGLSGTGDYEFDLQGKGVSIVTAQYQYWQNGAETPFNFTYTASSREMTFSVAGLNPIKLSLLPSASFSDLYIRAAAKSPTNVSSTTLKDMFLTVGSNAPKSLQFDAAQTAMTARSLPAGGTSAAILAFSDVISEDLDFVLSGVSIFSWTNGPDEPQRSNIAYQVKVGDFLALEPIPEPATFGLIGAVGLVGFSLCRRRGPRSRV